MRKRPRRGGGDEGGETPMAVVPFNPLVRLPSEMPAPACRLPTGELDENCAHDLISDEMIPWMLSELGKGNGRDQLAAEVEALLEEGDLFTCLKVRKWAERGDAFCDAILLRVGAKLQTRLVQQRELADGHMQILVYVQAALLRPPHKRSAGRPWHDFLYCRQRELYICLLIVWICRVFDVDPTRNSASRDLDRAPSAISLLVVALGRHELKLKEKTVQDDIWHGERAKRWRERGIIPSVERAWPASIELI